MPESARRGEFTRSCAWAAYLAASLAILSPRAAHAEPSQGKGGAPGPRKDWPCPGCVTIAPRSYSPDRPAPLFVALHGDEGSTRVILRTWKAPLERRGYIFLALRCPKEKGCANSFWRWRGDPSWIMDQVDAVEASYTIDRARVYLSGWSGGSTYIGIMAPFLSPRFAALNLNAGGAPPGAHAGCAPCKPPVYYFMGGRNPLLSFAERARDHFKQCGYELEWDFAPSLDHSGELITWSGPVKERILDWMETKRNVCLSSSIESKSSELGNSTTNPGGATGTNNMPANSSVSSPVAPPPSASGAPLPVEPERAAPPPSPGLRAQPGGGCGCGPAPGARATDSNAQPESVFVASALSSIALLLAALTRRK